MTTSKLVLSLAALGFVAAQKPGSTPDVHPELTTYRCTVADGCAEATNYLVLDSSAHWIHQANNQDLGCGSWGSGPDETACPTKEACAQNCISKWLYSSSTHLISHG